MKRKSFLLLGTAIASAATPLMAVSCLYENEPSVVYAKEYVKHNAFTEKSKITNAQSPAQLREFENKLFSIKKLLYTFSDFHYSFVLEFSFSNNKEGMAVDNPEYVSKEAIEKVVDNFLEDTPFYALYLSEKDRILRTTNTVVGKEEYQFSFSDQSPYNTIPSYVFNAVNKEYKNDRSVLPVATKLLKALNKTLGQTYSVFLNDQEYIRTNTYGIKYGFGPINLFDAVNLSGKSEDYFKVFNSTEFTDEEKEHFFNHVEEFFVNKPYYLYLESTRDREVEIDKKQKEYSKLSAAQQSGSKGQKILKKIEELLATNKALSVIIEEFKPLFTNYEGNLTAFEKAVKNDSLFTNLSNWIQKVNEQLSSKVTDSELEQLKTELTSAVTKAVNLEGEAKKVKLEELFTKYKQFTSKIYFKLFDQDYQRALTTIEKEKSSMKSSTKYLAELYAKILFANGVFKTQILEAHKGDDKVFLVQYYDQTYKKWKLFDVNLAYEGAKQEGFNIESILSETLPDGYVIDESFASAFHTN